MSAQLQEAQSQLRVDRRFAEITASFNGINLRQRFPELDREQRADLVRMARRILRDEELSSPVAEAEVASNTTAVTSPPRQEGHAGSTKPEDPQPEQAQTVTLRYRNPDANAPAMGGARGAESPAPNEAGWTELMQGGERSRNRGLWVGIWTLVIVATVGGLVWLQGDRLMALWSPVLVALDSGAEDVRDAGEGSFEVITAATDMRTVKDALAGAGLEVESADVTQLPSNLVPVEESDAKKVLRLIDALDDLDDVQAVFSNYDIDDSVMEKVLAET